MSLRRFTKERVFLISKASGISPFLAHECPHVAGRRSSSHCRPTYVLIALSKLPGLHFDRSRSPNDFSIIIPPIFEPRIDPIVTPISSTLLSYNLSELYPWLRLIKLLVLSVAPMHSDIRLKIV